MNDKRCGWCALPITEGEVCSDKDGVICAGEEDALKEFAAQKRRDEDNLRAEWLRYCEENEVHF